MSQYSFREKEFIMIEKSEYERLKKLDYATTYYKMVDEVFKKARTLLKYNIHCVDWNNQFQIYSKEEADIFAYKEMEKLSYKSSLQQFEIKELKEELSKIKESFWYFLVK